MRLLTKTKPVGIIDYGAGNIGSIANMLRKIGVDSKVVSSPADLSKTSKLILPGVGAFPFGMESLHSRGFIPPLERLVLQGQTPLLGICLGMQLMTEESEEGNASGLGWLPARTVKFPPSVRIPHMGWNSVEPHGENTAIFDGIDIPARFYFVHSYKVETSRNEIIAGMTEYGDAFVSAIAFENIVATQFHPEKSHTFGARLLMNFVNES